MHMISVTFIQLLPDCFDKADQITDIPRLVPESHIDNEAFIRKTIELGIYFHAAFSEFLPDIPGKNDIMPSETSPALHPPQQYDLSGICSRFGADPSHIAAPFDQVGLPGSDSAPESFPPLITSSII